MWQSYRCLDLLHNGLRTRSRQVWPVTVVGKRPRLPHVWMAWRSCLLCRRRGGHRAEAGSHFPIAVANLRWLPAAVDHAGRIQSRTVFGSGLPAAFGKVSAGASLRVRSVIRFRRGSGAGNLGNCCRPHNRFFPILRKVRQLFAPMISLERKSAQVDRVRHDRSGKPRKPAGPGRLSDEEAVLVRCNDGADPGRRSAGPRAEGQSIRAAHAAAGERRRRTGHADIGSGHGDDRADRRLYSRALVDWTRSLAGADTGLWVSGDYLFTFMRGSNVPALVTTSPSGTPKNEAGVLGNPGTTTLFGGGDRIDGDLRTAFASAPASGSTRNNRSASRAAS